MVTCLDLWILTQLIHNTIISIVLLPPNAAGRNRTHRRLENPSREVGTTLIYYCRLTTIVAQYVGNSKAVHPRCTRRSMQVFSLFDPEPVAYAVLETLPWRVLHKNVSFRSGQPDRPGERE
jgi:hypothetical protein